MSHGDHFLIETIDEAETGEDYTGHWEDNIPGCYLSTTYEGVEVACTTGLYVNLSNNILSKPPHQRVKLYQASMGCKK